MARVFEQAHHGEVEDAAFLDCVRASLPHAWDVITAVLTAPRAATGSSTLALTPNTSPNSSE